MCEEEFAQRIQMIRDKLYKTAMLYLGNHSQAVDVLDEAIYKGICSCRRLRKHEYFDTWITRIVINECYNEMRRQKRLTYLEELPELPAEELDTLELREAILRLPKELRDVVVLRFFTGLTVMETADVLKIPQGTVATRIRRALKLLRLELNEEVTP